MEEERNIQDKSALDHSVVRSLVDVLRALPQVQADPPQFDPELANTRYEARIEARFGELPLQLWVQVKADVFPRDARELLDHWRRAADLPKQAQRRQLLVAGQSVSPGARELLANEGVGYFERGGSLCLPFAGAYVLIDRPTERKRAKNFELFTEARTPVLQAMLLAPGLAYTVQDLAGIRTGSSSATVSKLMGQLELEDWLTVEGSGPFKRRRLSRPGAVLDAWAAAATARLPHRKLRRFFVRGHKAVDLPAVITGALPTGDVAGMPSFHFTAEAAAHHHAPFLTTWSVTTMRAMPHISDRLVDVLDAVEVQQGHNLIVIEDELSALRFFETFDPITVSSPVQTYIDLIRAPGRAPDAARYLREQLLKF